MNHKISNWDEYLDSYERSVSNPEEFWASIAESFRWHKKWESVLNWQFDTPKVNWFLQGKLNITENCLDRHAASNPDKVAIIWEPNNPEKPNRRLTYRELLTQVCKFANVLKNNGVKKGDRVCIYMPMIPELTVAVLACARIGAIHSVVFAGFSALSLRDRINDSECCLLVTADGLYRGEKTVNLKSIVDEALEDCPSIKKTIVFKRTGESVNMKKDRDLWWDKQIQHAPEVCESEIMDSEDVLFILYTSGSTGRPKGVVHTIAGYMVYTYYTFLNVFQYEKDDIFWCTADIGWVTGHSYLIYGPLLNGATTVMFEGVPTWPNPGRFWQVCDKLGVTKFYTAPTAIRSLMAAGLDYVRPYKLRSLKVLGSVGEPINEEAWHWYYENIGKSRCPIVDTWWQTETGGFMISPIAGITKLKPSWASLPLPGVQPVLVDKNGTEITTSDTEGFLCFKYPWPGIIRTLYGDHDRCKQVYFSTFKGLYFTGDACKKDTKGYYRIIGRVDDVINVSGHRLGTAEIESAINEHANIIESAVVGFPHDIKGQGIFAFVIPVGEINNVKVFKEEVRSLVSKMIGPIAKPDKILLVKGLPKTRSGKIMRRILRKIAEGDVTDLGDTSTLLDPTIVEEIIFSFKKDIT